MSEIDTSTEAVNALTAGCEYTGHPGRLLKMVRALGIERDAMRRRAEKAEAEAGCLRDALRNEGDNNE